MNTRPSTSLALACGFLASNWLMALTVSIACLAASYPREQSHGEYLNNLIYDGFIIIDPEGYEVVRFDE